MSSEKPVGIWRTTLIVICYEWLATEEYWENEIKTGMFKLAHQIYGKGAAETVWTVEMR